MKRDEIEQTFKDELIKWESDIFPLIPLTFIQRNKLVMVMTKIFMDELKIGTKNNNHPRT